ncbi:MAG: hypothetical protein ABIH25_04560 [Candidatus Woesearchaeota archaeon]
MKNKLFILLFILILLIPVIINARAEDGKLSTEEEKLAEINEIQLKLYDAGLIVEQLEEDGFPTQRVNDILASAQQILEAQTGRANSDFTLVLKYLEDLELINGQAYEARDEVKYVNELLAQTKEDSPNIDLTESEITIGEMNSEFNAEKYGEAIELAQQAYAKILKQEGEQTTAKLALASTQQTIKNFFINHWWKLLIVFGAGVILFLVFRNRFFYYRTKWKIKKLETEAKVVEELIKTSQLAYFEKGTMAESSYRIRIKKFSDLVRDIDRQIPLLKEELAKWRKSKTFNADELAQKKKDDIKNGKKPENNGPKQMDSKQIQDEKKAQEEQVAKVTKQTKKQESKLIRLDLKIAGIFKNLTKIRKDIKKVNKSKKKILKAKEKKVKKIIKPIKVVKPKIIKKKPKIIKKKPVKKTKKKKK